MRVASNSGFLNVEEKVSVQFEGVAQHDKTMWCVTELLYLLQGGEL